MLIRVPMHRQNISRTFNNYGSEPFGPVFDFICCPKQESSEVKNAGISLYQENIVNVGLIIVPYLQMCNVEPYNYRLNSSMDIELLITIAFFTCR